ncbi:hypothetical protein EJB05_17374, partial [Eragrostis curvula]
LLDSAASSAAGLRGRRPCLCFRLAAADDGRGDDHGGDRGSEGQAASHRGAAPPEAVGAASSAAAARQPPAAASSPTSSAWEPAAAEKASSDDRAPFAVALTPEEVEDDVYALTGARPRRRPRKRPRVVQRQLDTLFPGLWLTEITADAYKVHDE